MTVPQSASVTISGAGLPGPAGPAGAAGGALIPVAVQTGAFTAAAGQLVPVDTTSGAVTITLPAGPPDRSPAGVKMVRQGGANAVTIAASGTDRFNIAGGPATLTLSLLNQAAVMQYSASPALWYVTADDLTLASLDGRYVQDAGDLGGSPASPQVTATHLGAPLPVAQGGTGNTTGQPSGSAGGDLGGTYPNPAVTATHLSSALPLAQGGTASTTAAGALGNLGGAAVAGDLGGTSASPQVVSAHLASPLPLAQGGTANTSGQPSGTAGGDLSGTYPNPAVAKIGGTAVSLPLPLAQGGTGQVTAATAITALTGSQAGNAGKVLRSDGTNAALSAIQAGDVPTLNQSTTGTAAGLSGTPALPDGTTAATQTAGDNTAKIATGQFVTTAVAAETTRAQAAEALRAPLASPALTGTPTAPTAPALTGNTQVATTSYADSAVAAANVPTTGSPLAVNRGGTGQVTASAALNALAGAAVAGDIGGTSASPQVTGTHLASPLPLAQGGTGQNAASAAALLTALGAAQLSGAAFTGEVTVQAPVNPGDAVTKTYADAIAQGLSVKPSVQEATTAALPANTYNNGASGVGATLTATATGTLTVDGILVALNDRVLVKNEAAPANNGPYVCTTAGTIGVAYVLTRAADMNTAAQVPGAFCFTEQGTVNAAAGFTVASAGPFTIGTTAIPWTQFSGAGEITAGTGLGKSGNILSLAPDSAAGDIKALGAQSAGSSGVAPNSDHVHPTTGLVLTSGLPLAIASGGTGQATAAAGLSALGGAAVAGDLGNTSASPQVTATHLASPLPVAQGGTAGTTAAAGLASLGGAAVAGDIGGTSASPQVTGTHLSSALPLAQGGTGQASAAASYNALSPMTTLGDLEYESGAATASRLAGNTSATKNFLTQTGNGSVSAAPAWGTIASGDMPSGTTGAKGALQLDGTAGDIAALGAQAAGAVGKAADAGHVHPTTGVVLTSALPLAVGSGGTGSATRNFAGLLTPTAVRTTTYTAAAGDFVPCDTTGGAFTVTLPNAPADLTVVAAKMVVQGSTSAVTVAAAGSDVFNVTGGTTTRTLTLLSQAVLLQYKASGGIWYVLADDLPLAQLDSRYVAQSSLPLAIGSGGTGQTTAAAGLSALGGAAVAGDLGNTSASPQVTATHLASPLPVAQGGAGVFSPLAYGAAGNGSTDDTTAVQSAFTAAAAVFGIVDLGYRTFLTSSAIAMPSSVTIRGANSNQAGSGGGELINNTTNLFSVTGTVSSVLIQNCGLSASAGHIFSCASGSGVSNWVISNVVMVQTAAAKCIWYMPTAGTYINMLVEKSYLAASGSAASSPWYIVSGGNAANGNTWSRVWCAGNHMTVPFFRIENQGAGGYNSDNHFADLVMEQCDGGFINSLSGTYLTIDNVAGYDTTTFTSSLFDIGTGSGSNRSGYIVIRNSGRRGGTLAGGVYDVRAASNVINLIIENVGPEAGNGVYSVPAAQTLVLGPLDTTAADIKAAGTQSAGSSGSPPNSDHVHPDNLAWTAADSNFLVQNGDFLNAFQTFTMIAGTLYLLRLNIRQPMTITNICVMVNTPGSGTSSGTFAGLYSSAGTLLSGSPDVASSLTGGGLQPMALTAPQAVTPGFVWAALLTNLSVSQPHLFSWTVPVSDVNAGLGAVTVYRFAANGTGLTSLPGSITPSSNTNTGAALLWAAAT